jgi:hypothetical protein
MEEEEEEGRLEDLCHVISMRRTVCRVTMWNLEIERLNITMQKVSFALCSRKGNAVYRLEMYGRANVKGRLSL